MCGSFATGFKTRAAAKRGFSTPRRKTSEEVVVRGAERPPAEAVRNAAWIKSHPPAPVGVMQRLRSLDPSDDGELATVLLARSHQLDRQILNRSSADCGLPSL